MTCETFTYSAHKTDYSVCCAAGPNEAPSAPPQGVFSAGPLSPLIVQLWMWMQCYVSGVITLGSGLKLKPMSSQPSHIFRLPSSGPCEPPRAVRVNRSMMRKLRRLQRLQPAIRFDGPAYRPIGTRPDLSDAQYLEYMIRRHKWNRVRIHGLGERRSVALFKSMTAKRLLGFATKLAAPLMCHAPISPD